MQLRLILSRRKAIALPRRSAICLISRQAKHLPFVALIPNKIDQAHFVHRVAETLSVSEDAVKAELAKLLKPTVGAAATTAEPVHEPFMSRADTIERLVFGLHLLFKERGSVDDAAKAEAVLREAVGDTRFEELISIAENHRAALFEADLFLTRDSENDARDATADAYKDLKRESLHDAYRTALSALRAAETALDTEGAEKYMQELARLATLIK